MTAEDPAVPPRVPANRDRPHLSIVVVSRNDDHGGNPLERMQQFVDAWEFHCIRLGLHAELIVVEWNPPSGRARLSSVLQWSGDNGPLDVRIITVPPEVHARYAHGDRLPLYQMIGKNVGIRRARGQFILATNIDVVVDDLTVRYLRDNLEPGVLLRADRFDVPSTIPAGTIEERLAYWRQNVFHVYTRLGIFDVATGVFREFGPSLDVDGGDGRVFSQADLEYLYRLYFGQADVARHLCSIVEEHATNSDADEAPASAALHEIYAGHRVAHIYACGDFTLLARQDWMRLRGYPEMDAYSWNLDSVLLFAAFAVGLRQIVLPPSHRIFHIDHAVGSGWTPGGDQALFDRLRLQQIPHVSDNELLEWRRRIYALPEARLLNPEAWGLAASTLPETGVWRS
jgi:hypothetical protein